MADTTTTNYGLTKPEVGASEDTWGTKINTNLDTLDTTVDSIQGKSGAATLKHTDSAKLATTSTGIDVTGTATMDGLTIASGNQATIGVFGTSGLQMIGVTGGDNVIGTMGANEPLVLRTGSAERMRIESSGTVKISHADTASEGFRVIQTTAARTSGGALGLFYDDQAGTTQPTLVAQQNGTGDILQLFDGGSQVVTVKDGGNLLVGGTSAFGADTITLGTGGFAGIRNTGGACLELRRDSSDGSILDFQKDGTAVGSIGVTGTNDIAIYSTTANHGGLRLGEGYYIPTNNTGATADNAVDLGLPSIRYKDLYLSGTANVGSVVGSVSSTGLAGDFTNTNTSGYGLRVTTYGTGAQYGLAVDSYGGGYSRDFTVGVDGYIYSPPTYGLTTGASANMFVATDGSFQRSTSSLRYKNTITDATHGLTELLTLRPVTYKGNNDGDTVFGGLIAEEVHDAGLTEFVQYNDENQPDALAYGNMVSLCIKAIQEQQTLIELLTARIAALEE